MQQETGEMFRLGQGRAMGLTFYPTQDRYTTEQEAEFIRGFQYETRCIELLRLQPVYYD